MAHKKSSNNTRNRHTQKNGNSTLPLPPNVVVLGVDPGNDGAFVLLNGRGGFAFKKMPMSEKEISFGDVYKIILNSKATHIFLERAYGGQMGATAAFNYGRGFAKLEVAIKLAGISVIYVEPGKWAKVMHAGINSKYKPKEKSLIAVKRLYPKLVPQIPVGPKTKRMHEGIVDALLIAGYGLRLLEGK